MWSKRISAMIIACTLMLVGLSLCELSTAVAQEPLRPPRAADTYGSPELQYVPAGPAPRAAPAPEALTVSNPDRTAKTPAIHAKASTTVALAPGRPTTNQDR